MTTQKELYQPILIKAQSDGTLQHLAEIITKSLSKVIKEQCPNISDEERQKAVKKSVLEIFEEFGEVEL